MSMLDLFKFMVLIGAVAMGLMAIGMWMGLAA